MKWHLWLAAGWAAMAVIFALVANHHRYDRK